MADTVSFVQGSTSLALNSGDYNTLAIDLSTPAPDALMHIPDYGEDRLVRIEDNDRRAILQLRIIGADWDDVYNNMAILRRWLHEAARAEIDGDTNPVYLQLKRDATSTATNATRHRIKLGWIEGDNSFTPFAQKSEQVNDVVMSLILAPYGELTSTISLFNMLASSPHFVEDSDADDTSDGWTAVGAATVLSRATNHWLVGGVSQRITTDATNEDQGMYSTAVVTCAANAPVVAYAWVAKQSGTDTVLTIALIDGGGTHADSVEFDPAAPAGYDKMIVAPPGSTLTWYRYTVSDDGTGPRAAADARLLIYRDNTDEDGEALLLVDACYLRTGTTTAPDAWASTANIENRNDIQSTSPATENYLNYIDTWGIPGDAPALVEWQLLMSGGDDYEAMMVGSRSDGKALAADVPHWVNGGVPDFDNVLIGAWINHADAARTNGTVLQLTMVQAFDREQALLGEIEVFRRPVRVFAAVWCDSLVPTFRIGFGTTGITHAFTDAYSVNTVSTWELIDMGLMNISGAYPETLLSTGTPNLFIDMVTQDAGKIIELDFVLLMPTEQLLSHDYNASHSVRRYIDGVNKEVSVGVGAGYYVIPHLGSLWTLSPGSTMTRTVFVFYGDAAATEYREFSIAVNCAVTMEVTPRTRHLLGTF